MLVLLHLSYIPFLALKKFLNQKKSFATSFSIMRPIFSILLLGASMALAIGATHDIDEAHNEARDEIRDRDYDFFHLPTSLSRVHNPNPAHLASHSKRDDDAAPTSTTDLATGPEPSDFDSYEALAALESSLPSSSSSSSSSSSPDGSDDVDDLPTSLPSK